MICIYIYAFAILYHKCTYFLHTCCLITTNMFHYISCGLQMANNKLLVQLMPFITSHTLWKSNIAMNMAIEFFIYLDFPMNHGDVPTFFVCFPEGHWIFDGSYSQRDDPQIQHRELWRLEPSRWRRSKRASTGSRSTFLGFFRRFFFRSISKGTWR